MARTIKEIPAEEADRICKDIQIWWLSYLDGRNKDYSPETFRDGSVLRMPSGWEDVVYGIEIDECKPEYDTPTGPP